MLSQKYFRSGAGKVTFTDEMRLPQSWFWIGTIVLLLASVVVIESDSIEAIVGAYVITVAALIPSYLWITGRAKGLPIFPIFALTHIWTYAVPLVIDHYQVMQYTPLMRLGASLTTAGFILLGTLVWYQFVKAAPAPPSVLWVMDGKKSEPYLLTGYAAGVLLSIAFAGGWVNIDAGLLALIRATLIAVTNLATFVLGYRWGKREISKQRVSLFVVLLVLYIASNTATLLIISALSSVFLLLIAFSLGRRKIPIMPLALLVLVIIPLHYGKAEMRAKYWTGDQRASVKPWEYPGLFVEWAGYSWDHLTGSDDRGDADPQSIAERAGLVYLMLMVQDATSKDVPFLNGATYTIIPDLLIPRFLNPDKAASHEGTYLLNIQFNLQTREDTRSTTIGWGLLNEAYANFGLWGVAGLAIILGSLYGAISRWSANCPVLSFRYLFAILVINIAYQSEFSASVYVTALFQSTVPLLAFVAVLMRRRSVNEPAPERTPAIVRSGSVATLMSDTGTGAV